eukprot:symbB.v1.2.032909.t1/scaffold3915.1/size48385/4
MGWSLAQAGIIVAVGAIARILVQQAILRIGLWTSAVFSALNLTSAILAALFTEQEWAVLLQAACAAMLDVTVAVEALAFDQWSDSEAMVSQAQSTVLSMFTIACALAATISGIVFDTAGWKGLAFCHAGCASLQLLCIISQPTTWQSLKDLCFLEIFFQPGLSWQEQAEDQPSSPLSNRGSVAVAEAEGKEATPELPGAVRDEEPGPPGKKKPRKSRFNRGSMASASSRGASPSPRTSAYSRSASPGPRSSAISGTTNGTSGTGGTNSSGHGSVGTRSWQLASRIGHFTNRQSMVSGRSGDRADRAASRERTRSFRKSRLSAGTMNTKGSGKSHATNKTARTNKTMNTVMSKLSAFTNGENFEHHYALRNALLPQVASRNAQVQLVEPDDDDVDEEERETGSPARVVGRKSKVKAKLPRDMYFPAAFSTIGNRRLGQESPRLLVICWLQLR